MFCNNLEYLLALVIAVLSIGQVTLASKLLLKRQIYKRWEESRNVLANVTPTELDILVDFVMEVIDESDADTLSTICMEIATGLKGTPKGKYKKEKTPSTYKNNDVPKPKSKKNCPKRKEKGYSANGGKVNNIKTMESDPRGSIKNETEIVAKPVFSLETPVNRTAVDIQKFDEPKEKLSNKEASRGQMLHSNAILVFSAISVPLLYL